ncbi:MAG: Trm112 family protein [Candidatus Aenigmarchaeota archaeon]|nr:Trm112 family protein [Candidatus Aenigmarchaeota archaeon]
MIKKELLDILACPKCKGDLNYDKKKNKLTCKKCRLRYGVLKGNIPNMLIDEAEKY